jgi:hypothetical protein
MKTFSFSNLDLPKNNLNAQQPASAHLEAQIEAGEATSIFPASPHGDKRVLWH